MIAQKYFVIDFDSTFTQVEALDLLGEIALENDSDKEQKLQKIKEITDKGMDGTMTLKDSIAKRLEITEKAVHDLLYRARNSLRVKLKQLALLNRQE